MTDTSLNWLINECQIASYSCKAMQMPSLSFFPKKRRDQKLIDSLMANLEPLAPLKKSELAITIQLPKRKGHYAGKKS